MSRRQFFLGWFVQTVIKWYSKQICMRNHNALLWISIHTIHPEKLEAGSLIRLKAISRRAESNLFSFDRSGSKFTVYTYFFGSLSEKNTPGLGMNQIKLDLNMNLELSLFWIRIFQQIHFGKIITFYFIFFRFIIIQY